MGNKLLFLPHCLSGNYLKKITALGENKGYDVYVLPGGSRMKKILEDYDLAKVEKIVGVACEEEIPLANNFFEKINFPLEKVFSEELTVTGCKNTECNLSELEKKL